MLRTKSAILTLVMFIFVMIYLFPYTWMVMTAFREPADTFARPPKFLFEPTLAAFVHVFTQMNFASFLLNSTIITCSSVAITLVVSIPAAYALAHFAKNATGFLLAILVARMIPAVAILVPVYLLANNLRQLDTFQILVLINVAFNIPFAIWMIRGFFMDIPDSLREAAIIDGASEWDVLLIIALPLVRGGVLATAVFVFIGAWNEFLFALVLTGTQTMTSPLAILGFRTVHGIEWGNMSAAAFLVSLPVIVFAFVTQKYLVQGLTLGAVK